MTLLKSGALATGVGEGDGDGAGVGVALGVGDGTGVGEGLGVGLGVADGLGLGVGTTIGAPAEAGKTTRFCRTAAALAGLETNPMATDWPGARDAFQDLGVTL